MNNHTHEINYSNINPSYGIGSNTHIHGIGGDLRSQLLHADLALMVVNGELHIIKNRYGLHGSHIPVNVAIPMFSRVLTDMLFKNNDLKMFKEGLKKQIESAIKTTIKNFHESR
jgi:hypothetical protein